MLGVTSGENNIIVQLLGDSQPEKRQEPENSVSSGHCPFEQFSAQVSALNNFFIPVETHVPRPYPETTNLMKHSNMESKQTGKEKRESW